MKSLDEMTHEEQVQIITQFDMLAERVRMFIWEDMKDFYSSFMGEGLFRFIVSVAGNIFIIRDCESPIEQLLMLAMNQRFCTSEYYASVTSQATIKTAGHKYRVDFLITIIDDINGHANSDSQQQAKEFERYVVIECDGHEFHERTKQQAQKDKQRDRNLQIAGYPVLRFTGSEIYKDPMKCCLDIETYILMSRFTK